MILIVPGLWNSGPEHWQSQWEAANPGWRRVMHRDWDTPTKDEWVAELDLAIAAAPEPPLLVAHGLGCITIAHWAKRARWPILGAFLVAPSDVSAAGFPIGPTGFSPVPVQALPFPSLVVASTDDHRAALDRVAAFARGWRSELVGVGRAGHLNGASGHGPWPQGLAMVEDFRAQLGAASAAALQ